MKPEIHDARHPPPHALWKRQVAKLTPSMIEMVDGRRLLQGTCKVRPTKGLLTVAGEPLLLRSVIVPWLCWGASLLRIDDRRNFEITTVQRAGGCLAVMARSVAIQPRKEE
jgi:hypothetical protein